MLLRELAPPPHAEQGWDLNMSSLELRHAPPAHYPGNYYQSAAAVLQNAFSSQPLPEERDSPLPLAPGGNEGGRRAAGRQADGDGDGGLERHSASVSPSEDTGEEQAEAGEEEEELEELEELEEFASWEERERQELQGLQLLNEAQERAQRGGGGDFAREPLQVAREREPLQFAPVSGGGRAEEGACGGLGGEELLRSARRHTHLRGRQF